MKLLFGSLVALTLLNCSARPVKHNQPVIVDLSEDDGTCRTTSDCAIQDVCGSEGVCVAGPDPKKLK